LSFDALHDRSISPLETALAVRDVGWVGGVVSGDGVVTLAVFEYVLRFPAASVARTR
jgi:hypothetical protein